MQDEHPKHTSNITFSHKSKQESNFSIPYFINEEVSSKESKRFTAQNCDACRLNQKSSISSLWGKDSVLYNFPGHQINNMLGKI